MRTAVFFTLACLTAAFWSLFIPKIWVTFFAPFLILQSFHTRLIPLISWAIGCGILMDLLSNETPFGLYSLAYALTIVLLQPLRQRLQAERWFSLPALTLFFALIATLVQWLTLLVMGESLRLTFAAATTDLLLLPFCDALYALLLYVLPLKLFFNKPLAPPTPYRPERPT